MEVGGLQQSLSQVERWKKSIKSSQVKSMILELRVVGGTGLVQFCPTNVAGQRWSSVHTLELWGDPSGVLLSDWLRIVNPLWSDLPGLHLACFHFYFLLLSLLLDSQMSFLGNIHKVAIYDHIWMWIVILQGVASANRLWRTPKTDHNVNKSLLKCWYFTFFRSVVHDVLKSCVFLDNANKTFIIFLLDLFHVKYDIVVLKIKLIFYTVDPVSAWL